MKRTVIAFAIAVFLSACGGDDPVTADIAQTVSDDAGGTSSDSGGTVAIGDDSGTSDDGGTVDDAGSISPDDGTAAIDNDAGSATSGGDQTISDDAGSATSDGDQTISDDAGSATSGGDQTISDDAGSVTSGGGQTISDDAGSATADGGQTAAPALEPGFVIISNSEQTVTEGGSASIQVQRTGGTDGAVSVNVSTVAGTAGADDFTPLNTTFSWSDGEAGVRVIGVNTLADQLTEPDESFSVVLTNVTGGAVIGDRFDTHVVTIAGNTPAPALEPGFVIISNSEQTVTEGGSASIQVQRTGGTDGAVSVNVSTVAGTAGADDFTPLNTTFFWSDGDAGVRVVAVNTLTDQLTETDESFSVVLSDVTGGAVIGDRFDTHVVTIAGTGVLAEPDTSSQTSTPVNPNATPDQSVGVAPPGLNGSWLLSCRLIDEGPMYETIQFNIQDDVFEVLGSEFTDSACTIPEPFSAVITTISVVYSGTTETGLGTATNIDGTVESVAISGLEELGSDLDGTGEMFLDILLVMDNSLFLGLTENSGGGSGNDTGPEAINPRPVQLDQTLEFIRLP